MRDDRHKWPAAQTEPKSHDLGSAELRHVTGLSQTLVSGSRVLRQISEPQVSWPDVIDQKSYALVLRRDRVLVINGRTRMDGWNPEDCQAVSNVSDGFVVLELDGEGAFDLLRRGAEISLKNPSRSVSRLVFGIEAYVSRYRSPTCFRIHVPRAHSDALQDHLISAHAAM